MDISGLTGNDIDIDNSDRIMDSIKSGEFDYWSTFWTFKRMYEMVEEEKILCVYEKYKLFDVPLRFLLKNFFIIIHI